MKKFLLFLATIVAAASCQNDNTVTPSVDEATTISVNVSTSAPDSRVNITDGDNDAWVVTWNEDDKLGGWSTDPAYDQDNSADYEEQTYQSSFSIAEGGYDDKNAQFTGNIVYKSDKMCLVHPYNYSLGSTKSNNKISLDLSEQNIAADFSNLNSNTYMISNEFEVEAVTSLQSHNTSIYMSHVGAAVELKMKFATASATDYTITKIVIGSDEAGLPTKGDLSLSDAAFTTTENGAITLTSEGLTATDGIYTSRFNIFPTEDITGTTIPVEVTLHDADDKFYTASASITAGGELERATNNTIYAILGSLTAAAMPATTIEVTHDNLITAMGIDSSTAHEAKVDNAVYSLFTITSDKSSASTEFRLWSKDSTIRSYAGNEVTFTAAEGIAITNIEFSTSKISNTSIAKFDEKVWSGNASEVTLTLVSGNNSYIKVTCEEESSDTNVLHPEITEVSKTTVELSGNGGEETVIVSGFDISDSNVTVSHNNKFDVTYSDKVITIECDENTTGADITDVITISNSTDSTNKFTINVTQSGEVLAAGEYCKVDWTAEGLGLNLNNDTPLEDTYTYENYKISIMGYATTAALYHNGDGYVRIYKDEEIVIESTDNKVIENIVITSSSSSYAKFSSEIGTNATSGSVYTWSGNSDKVTINVSAASRIKYIEINKSDI